MQSEGVVPREIQLPMSSKGRAESEAVLGKGKNLASVPIGGKSKSAGPSSICEAKLMGGLKLPPWNHGGGKGSSPSRPKNNTNADNDGTPRCAQQ